MSIRALIERNAMWKTILFGLMSLASIALSACNTIEGAGRDVTAAGREVSEEAREHKRY
jgi:predicted small secreted protein